MFALHLKSDAGHADLPLTTYLVARYERIARFDFWKRTINHYDHHYCGPEAPLPAESPKLLKRQSRGTFSEAEKCLGTLWTLEVESTRGKI